MIYAVNTQNIKKPGYPFLNIFWNCAITYFKAKIILIIDFFKIVERNVKMHLNIN